MNEHNSDPINQKKGPAQSTALIPNGESSVIPVRTDSSEDSFASEEHPGEASHHPKKHPRRTPGQRRRVLRRILLSAGTAVLALIVLSGIFAAYLIAKAPDLDTLTVSPSESATYIYDQDGNILRKLTLSSSNREIVSLDEIPASVQNALVAIEDARFFEHGGIDLRGIARAFLNGLAKGRFSEGASTITQQLIKNSIFTEWTQESSFFDRLSRKIQEQYLAIRLENQMSKEEILENYLNIINFGSGCYGVQAASRRYFGKPVTELTLSESAVLAAIPQNPTAMNPITFPENNSRRRMTVLDYMEAQGYITAGQHEQALNDNVYDRIREYDAGYDGDSVYTYYEDALIDQVISLLTEEKGCTYDQAYRMVYSGGLAIVSAQDQRIQDICDQEFSNTQNFPAGTLYGADYALSISDSDGIVTHYGQEHFRSYVRETFDPSFNLMCQDTETIQKYADAFREAMLAASQKTDSGEGTSDEEGNKSGDAGNRDGDSNSDREDDTLKDSGSENNSDRENGILEDSGSENNSDKENGILEDSSESGDANAPKVLAERLTFSPQPQASVVVIDQSTGFVRAIVGGRGEKTASLTLNRATRTTRQPGSTFKILTAYAPALDACGQTLATKYENQPYEYQDGTPVSNWDLNDYSDPVSIREAITRSINVAAVRCITEITPQLGFQYAQKFGFSTLHEYYESGGNYSSDIVQPLALGGITQGVSNLELCSAYAAIANGGILHKPKFFTRITDRHGNVIVDYTELDDSSDDKSRKEEKNSKNSSKDSSMNDSKNKNGDTPDGTEVIRPATAWLLTDAMRDVVENETGTAYGLISAGAMPAAGKTGTTSNYKDIWFAGYTPYYTCCVWGGYDNNDSLPDSSTYHTYNKTLWSSIMTRIHASLPVKDFERPDDIVAVKLCSESGLPAVEKGCTDIRQEFFEKGTEPTGKCPLHKPAPETEKDLIYQDILDELFPESRKSGSSGTSDSSRSKFSVPETPDNSELPDSSDFSGSSASSATEAPNDSKLPDSSDFSGSSASAATEAPNDSELPDPSDFSGSSASSATEAPNDSELPGFSGFSGSSASSPEVPDNSELPDSSDFSGSSASSPEAPDDSELPGYSDFSDSSASPDDQKQSGQPQTTSLDDMIDQLSRYGLP